MKLVRPTLKILLEKTKDIEDAEKFLGTHSETYTNLCGLWDRINDINGANSNLHRAAKEWIAEQESRENGWAVDQYHVQIVRTNLERAIIEYRKTLADVYDYMGDKGLV